MSVISVHIVTHNSASTLRWCLDGLLEQCGLDFSIHIFDNASSDDTLSIVRAYRLPVVSSRQNIGYAGAHNHLIAETVSEFILTLNPDTCLQPGFLQAMLSVLQSNLVLGSASGLLLRVDHLGATPSGIDSAGLYMRRNRRQGLRDEGLTPESYPPLHSRIFGPDGAAAFYRRAMLEDIRLGNEIFDSAFFMHKEDVDISWRARLRGWQSVHVSDAIAHHIRSFRPGQRDQPPSLRQISLRNRYLLMLKNEILPHFLLSLPAILLYELAIWGYVLLRERDSLLALPSLMRLLPATLKKRSIIQSRRATSWREMNQWFKGNRQQPPHSSTWESSPITASTTSRTVLTD